MRRNMLVWVVCVVCEGIWETLLPCPQKYSFLEWAIHLNITPSEHMRADDGYRKEQKNGWVVSAFSDCLSRQLLLIEMKSNIFTEYTGYSNGLLLSQIHMKFILYGIQFLGDPHKLQTQFAKG